MSRYTGPRARINRRFSQAIFTPGNAEERKPYIPGMHGPRLRRKASEYAMGLNEKQKARYMYGMSEKQFRIAFNKAKRTKGVTGTLFLRSLELRLYNVVYSLGLTKSRSAARQFVTHGHILANGKKVDIPSYLCSAGDVIEVANRSHSRQLAVNNIEMTRFRSMPPWLEFNSTLMKGTVNRAPERDEIGTSINEQLIVEFYSR
jgi:small subunit ribosomal protein S4